MAVILDDDVSRLPLPCREEHGLQPCAWISYVTRFEIDVIPQMTCWKCSQHFCYRCGVHLNPTQAYAHFSIAGTPCFNQLFDVIDVDPADWEPMD